MFGKPKKDKDTKAGGGGRERGGRGDKPKHTSGLAGLMGMDPGMGMAEGGDDDDFEAELAKLTGMGGKAAKSKVILILTVHSIYVFYSNASKKMAIFNTPE